MSILNTENILTWFRKIVEKYPPFKKITIGIKFKLEISILLTITLYTIYIVNCYM